ncbi:MAG: nucleoside deaminase [Desulfobacterales bacterium]|nr:nucleoside deaminase [Desulfobacterales bacterium]MBF0396598.1 nucleoside deaminase [Desulfobacterales bacterium]
MIRKSFSVVIIFVFLVLLLFFGKMLLNADETKALTSLDKLEKRIALFKPDPKYVDDKAALVTLQEAIAAAKEGNYGIGACLVNKKNGEVIQRGHNRIFKPYFRSDMHAEMDTLTGYENRIKTQGSKVDGLILYTSLEPCPMCLARIITSGVQKVYYLAPDQYGGMVHLFKNLPSIWQEIARGRIYDQAQCSPELRDIANETFKYSSKILDEYLKKE